MARKENNRELSMFAGSMVLPVPVEAPMAGVRGASRPARHCATCSLHEPCLPCRLAAPEAARFADFDFTRKRVKRGESLYRAGGEFESLFAIRCGFFKSSAVLADGRDWVTGFYMTGEILGMDGIGTDRHASEAIALEDSEVCIIPYGRLEEPRLQRELHKVMSRELVRDQGVMLLLATMHAEERVAAFLLNLSQRFVARGLSPHEFHLRMTRGEIGSYLGLSLETVSRLLSRFHAGGLISVQKKHIRILDIPGLAAAMIRVNA